MYVFSCIFVFFFFLVLHKSFHLSIYLSIYLSVCLSVCQSVCQFITTTTTIAVDLSYNGRKFDVQVDLACNSTSRRLAQNSGLDCWREDNLPRVTKRSRLCLVCKISGALKREREKEKDRGKNMAALTPQFKIKRSFERWKFAIFLSECTAQAQKRHGQKTAKE